MSFFTTVEQYQDFSFTDFFAQVTDVQIEQVLHKEVLSPADFLILLSPRAANHLEAMAQRAHQLTVQYFGRTIQLFIPLYISNFCANQCAYCCEGLKFKRHVISLTRRVCVVCNVIYA